MKPAPDRLLKCLTMRAMCVLLVCAAGLWAPQAASAPAPVFPGETASGLPPEQAAELPRRERFRHLSTHLRLLGFHHQMSADSNAVTVAQLRSTTIRRHA